MAWIGKRESVLRKLQLALVASSLGSRACATPSGHPYLVRARGNGGSFDKCQAGSEAHVTNRSLCPLSESGGTCNKAKESLELEVPHHYDHPSTQ
ncbi:hypothetical protein B0J18DRAFT_433112 [Chaetomium sp. MPI-SDFR-AT-0129]|nr:hypothetical protein B0J18DRAFT_433112 [Chaetomium sp. MPI-SDFR-AT-0129]